jgi:hypothetical protein
MHGRVSFFRYHFKLHRLSRSRSAVFGRDGDRGFHQRARHEQVTQVLHASYPCLAARIGRIADTYVIQQERRGMHALPQFTRKTLTHAKQLVRQACDMAAVAGPIHHAPSAAQTRLRCWRLVSQPTTYVVGGRRIRVLERTALQAARVLITTN